MKFQFFIGIDMGKTSFDFCIMDENRAIIDRGVVDNEPASIWIKALPRRFDGFDFWENALFCLEHTGYYGLPLLSMLAERTGTKIWLESPLQIKRSMGMKRGKSDGMAAKNISVYSLDFQRRVKFWEPPKRNLQRLDSLLSHRARMVKSLMSLRNALNEEADFASDDLHLEMGALNAPVISELEAAIAAMNAKIDALMKEDENFARQAEIIQSIPGFGRVISAKLIQVTLAFTRLNEPRTLACYAGVAPFEHSSGTSIKGKTRVSHLANKDVKKLLHIAALVTIRKTGIMRAYFERKVAEGKNKMSVINAVRNKLVHILCAGIKNDVMYQRNFQHSL